jgi:flagellar hook-length control protein FliK
VADFGVQLTADATEAGSQTELLPGVEYDDVGDPAHRQQDGSASDPGAPPTDLATTTDIAAATVHPQSDTATSTAAVGPIAAPSPVVRATQSASGPSSAGAVVAVGPVRSRVPADVVARAGSGPNRPAAVEIDATRLLSRVARAFAAAQERDGEITLRLSPPELGSLRLDIRVQDGALVARLQTETDAARAAILDNLPALRERLNEQGVRIERFDVDLMQRQPGGMSDQTGGGQNDDPAATLRAAPSPRPRSELITAASSAPLPASTADGLNVIV